MLCAYPDRDSATVAKTANTIASQVFFVLLPEFILPPKSANDIALEMRHWALKRIFAAKSGQTFVLIWSKFSVPLSERPLHQGTIEPGLKSI
jgi:hypothetical protein